MKVISDVTTYKFVNGFKLCMNCYNKSLWLKLLMKIISFYIKNKKIYYTGVKNERDI